MPKEYFMLMSCPSTLEQPIEVQPRSAKLLNGALLLIGILAAACIAIPAYVFLWRVYPAHLKYPETVEGGIELVTVFLIFALAVLLIRRSRVCSIIVVLVSMLYLQLHSILLPAAAALLLLESLLQIGRAVQRLIKLSDWRDCNLQLFLGRFIVGAASWVLGAVVLSVLGMGTIPSLLFYTIALALISAIAAPGAPLSVAIVRRFELLSSRDKILVLLLLILILTQFGKVNYDTDFDSTWYGLRPERVLVGPHSMFDDLKLMHFVYYYPKQFEALTLPLASLDRGVFIAAFNVILLVLSFLAVFRIGRELDSGRTGALLITALTGSIPGFLNMASTAKTDNLMSLYAFLSALFLWKWCKDRRAIDFCYGFSALLGMIATKITAYAYAPLLAIGFIAVGIWLHFKDRQRIRSGEEAQPPIDFGGGTRNRAPLIIALIAVCACGGMVMRTWMLTGIPTLPAFVDVWTKLGFSQKFPWNQSVFGFIGVPVDTIKEFFTHWYCMLFNPQRYGHYVIAWPGNAGFFSACAVLILFAARRIRRERQIAFLCACLPVMLCGIAMACLLRRYGDGDTDGNYYIVPVILTLLSASGVLANVSGKIRTVMLTCCFGFILLYLPIMFVSHWSWHSGTQAFSFELNKTLFDQESVAEGRLKSAGAWEIEEYVRKNSRRGLCVGFSNGEETALHMLSCIHEDFEQSGSQFGPIFDSEALFWKYLAWAHPELIFMPKSDSFHASRPGTPIRLAFEELAQKPGVIKIESKNFLVLDISQVTMPTR